jgi:hypothetical protein
MLSASRLPSSLGMKWQAAVSRYPVNKIGKIRWISVILCGPDAKKAGSAYSAKVDTGFAIRIRAIRKRPAF